MTKILYLLPLLALFLGSCGGTRTAVDTPARSFREWYYPDGIIMANGTTPDDEVHGSTSRVEEFLVISNLTEKETTATLTYYFEEDPPRQVERKVSARGSTVYNRAKFPEKNFPYRKLYGVKIVSPDPIMVQPTRAGSEEAPPGQLPTRAPSGSGRPNGSTPMAT